jgi:hypothetical protein
MKSPQKGEGVVQWSESWALETDREIGDMRSE